MSIARMITKNLSWLAAAELFSKLVGFFLIILITRYLGPEGYGQYAFALSFVMFFAFLADFGFGPYLTREIAKDPKKTDRLVNEVFGAKLIFTGIAFVLILLSLFVLHKPAPVLWFTFFAGLTILSNSFHVLLKAIFQGHEQMKYESFGRFLEKATWFVLIVLAIFFDLEILGLILAGLFATLIKVMVSFRFTEKHFVHIRPHFAPEAWKNAIRQSFYFTLINFFFIIYFKIDTVMLSYMKGDLETGWYGSAYDLIYALTFIPMFMTASVYPVISRFYQQANEKLERTIPRLLKYFYLLALPISILLLLFSNEIISVLYPRSFSPAVPMFQVLSLAFLFGFLNYPLNLFLGAIHLHRISTFTTGASTLLNIGLNLFLIPRYGGVGAAVATLTTEIILLGLSMLILHRSIGFFRTHRWITMGKLLIPFLFSVPVFALLDRTVSIKIGVAGIFLLGYAFLLWALPLISKQDRTYALEILSKD